MAIRIAIIGTGGVARKSYLPALASHDDVELSYFNRTTEKADACAAEFGGRVHTSIESLLDDQPDAVMVLTSETARADVLDALLPRGPKRIFCEKPLVAVAGQANVTEQDFFRARDIVQQAEAANIELAMVFNYRFFDYVTRAREAAAERDFGAVTEVSAIVHYACWSHCIDLIHHFAGPVSHVTALAGEQSHGTGGFKACDMAGVFRTSGGATGTILGTSGISFDSPLFDLTIAFERGRVRLVGLDEQAEIIDYAANHHERLTLTANQSRWDPYKRSFAKSVAAYLQSIRDDAPPPVPGRAGLQELQFEAALRRSAAEARVVDVEKELAI